MCLALNLPRGRRDAISRRARSFDTKTPVVSTVGSSSEIGVVELKVASVLVSGEVRVVLRTVSVETEPTIRLDWRYPVRVSAEHETER